jgi:hypothetical protein
MAYPVYGTAGTEVLYRTTIKTLAAVETAFRWDRTNATTGTATYDVDDHHIVTVLSVTFVNHIGSTKNLQMTVNDGANAIYLFSATSIGDSKTFVWNDRFVLVAGDKLLVLGASGSNFDCYCTYIDQAF